jgi:hypothetical protein
MSPTHPTSAGRSVSPPVRTAPRNDVAVRGDDNLATMGGDLLGQGSTVELRVPPLTRFGGLVRVLTTSLAADEGFAIDALAALRTAVGEAFDQVTESEPDDFGVAGADVLVRFWVSPGCVVTEFPQAAAAWATAMRRVSAPINPAGDVLETGNGRISLSNSNNLTPR